MSQYGTMAWGTTPLNPSVVITTGVNDIFSFDVDGVNYTITLNAGTYYTSRDHFMSELISPINDGLISVNAPVRARLGGIHMDEHKNVLVIEHNDKLTNHIINNFGGTAKDTIFGEVFIITPPFVT